MKYKQYDQARKRAERPQTTPRKPTGTAIERKERTALGERPANIPSSTPQREAKAFRSLQPLDVSPSRQEEPTPACVKCALGPTPQKDGEVLGIFDMLFAPTPSKSLAPSALHDTAVGATPSKATSRSSDDILLSRTPQSSGKRFYLGAFASTPLKRKHPEEHETPSTAKRQYSTPSFLRRHAPLARLNENDEEPTMAEPPFRKRGLVRSLSSIIQGLKKQEEQRMDEDWDVLNEIESGQPAASSKAPRVLVEDSQAVEMPLGPDQGDDSEEESGNDDPGALDANGQPRKVWKKKGLKRQTRRVIMRPVLHKPTKRKDSVLSDIEEDDTRMVEGNQQAEPGASRLTGDASLEKYVSEDSAGPSPRKRSKKREKTKGKAKAGHEVEQANGENESTARKPKKVSAQAHANFRRLKIKNKNSKANGRGGKFGKRR